MACFEGSQIVSGGSSMSKATSDATLSCSKGRPSLAEPMNMPTGWKTEAKKSVFPYVATHQMKNLFSLRVVASHRIT